MPTGEYDDVRTGFAIDDRSVGGRPMGLAVVRDGALLVSDHGSDTIWRLSWSGEGPKP